MTRNGEDGWDQHCLTNDALLGNTLDIRAISLSYNTISWIRDLVVIKADGRMK